MNKTNFAIGTIWFSLFWFFVGAFGWGIFQYLQNPIANHPPQPRLTFSVPKGMGLRELTQELHEAGFLDQPQMFLKLAAARGEAGKIKAGDYEIEAAWTPPQFLNILVEGRTRLLRVMIPEGLTFREIVERLVEQGLGTRENFLALTQAPELLALIPWNPPPDSLEGFLFPETYLFPKAPSESDVLAAMIKQFFQNYPPEFQTRARELGFEDEQILTLASMIEKETGREADRDLISGVFHNRLKRGMRLESDPTVIYGLKEFDGNLTRQHLQTPTPYNTYTIPGLPPGPICNPGKASLHSALYPATNDYLFFVARGDGSSEFSRTLTEHNRAVNRYQKRRTSARP